MIETSREPVAYNDDVVRKCTIAALFWGIVGMLVGVLARA